MKNYSHIIYNSSEKNRSGAVGFGVRSATEGTPPALLEAMERNELFIFHICGPNVNSSALQADPDAIKKLVPSYFFRVLKIAEGQNAYILGRSIGVGYDYTFYQTGKPGRLGNYVVDTYAFSEPPTAEEFEILLEDAAAGNNHFIPADPSPRTENEEMREISLGHKPDMKPEALSFKANAKAPVSEKTIDLLFAFIQSRKEGKPVLVKSDINTPPVLMAGLAALVPQNQIENLTFLTNHADEGKKQGINIVFINEYYTCEIFARQWVVLDLNENQHPVTKELETFRSQVENYIKEGKFEEVHKLVDWMLSETYEKAKDLPQSTNLQLFNYLYDYPKFDVDALTGDTQLRELLNDTFRRDPAKSKALFDSLQERYDDIEDIDSLGEWLKFIFALQPIDASPVVEENKKAINNNVFEDSESFKRFYKKMGTQWEDTCRIALQPDRFPKRNEILSDLNPEEWTYLYPRFLSDHKDDPVYLIKRMLKDGVYDRVLPEVRKRSITDNETFVRAVDEVLADAPAQYETLLIKTLAETLPTLSSFPIDFLTEYSAKISESAYTPLFRLQIESLSPRTASEVVETAKSLRQFRGNPNYGGWMQTQKAKTLINSAFEGIISGVKRGQLRQEEAVRLAKEFAELATNSQDSARFYALIDALRGASTSEYTGLAGLWDLANKLEDGAYLRHLAPAWLEQSVSKEPRRVKEYVERVINDNLMTEEEIIMLSHSSRNKNHYIAALLLLKKYKPQEKLEYLVTRLNFTDEQALAFLNQPAFKEDHDKILKSRQPSVFSKIGSSLKGMFSKKDKSVEEEECSDRKESKNIDKRDSRNSEKGKVRR